LSTLEIGLLIIWGLASLFVVGAVVFADVRVVRWLS
jgi:hypothetical protein